MQFEDDKRNETKYVIWMQSVCKISMFIRGQQEQLFAWVQFRTIDKIWDNAKSEKNFQTCGVSGPAMFAGRCRRGEIEYTIHIHRLDIALFNDSDAARDKRVSNFSSPGIICRINWIVGDSKRYTRSVRATW